MRVLFIEDHPTTAKSVERIVKLKHEVFTATNCAQAVTLLDRQPDLILMDIGLPDCDGVTLIAQIRVKLPAIPIIATTAYALLNEREKCFQAGCTEYLSKPY